MVALANESSPCDRQGKCRSRANITARKAANDGLRSQLHRIVVSNVKLTSMAQRLETSSRSLHRAPRFSLCRRRARPHERSELIVKSTSPHER